MDEKSLHMLTQYTKYSHEMQMGRILINQYMQFCMSEGAIVEVSNGHNRDHLTIQNLFLSISFRGALM